MSVWIGKYMMTWNVDTKNTNTVVPWKPNSAIYKNTLIGDDWTCDKLFQFNLHQTGTINEYIASQQTQVSLFFILNSNIPLSRIFHVHVPMNAILYPVPLCSCTDVLPLNVPSGSQWTRILFICKIIKHGF